MTTQQFHDEFLSHVKTFFSTAGAFWSGRTFQLANKYDIQERYVREILTNAAQQNLISMTRWDGERLRSWTEWTLANDFFLDEIRITLLAAGANYVENLADNPRQLIGFTAD